MDQVIAFATLFLGLVSGPREVKMLVGEQVAAVELRLDGSTVGGVSAPPWHLICDFGALEPHHLVAVAFDGDGVELGRAGQWINLPRPPAELGVVLDRPGGEQRLVARLTWQSLAESAPTRIFASFDDEPLEVTEPKALPLPPHDPERLHFLHVEVDFDDGSSAQADLTFGGLYADRVNTELTALPVLVEDGGWRGASSSDHQVLVDGQLVRTVAVETGPADVVVVRDRSARPHFEAMLRRELDRMRSNHTLSNLSTLDRLRALLPLFQIRLHFLWPFVEPQSEGRRYELFPQSQWLTTGDGGFAWLLSQMSQPDYAAEAQRLADATAVAGMQASRRNRRRAVLLVLGDEPVDASLISAREARRFLALLRVPLHVFRVAQPSGGPSAASPSGWGDGHDVSKLSGLRRAVKELHDSLDRQRILWVEGRHLPQDLALGPDAEGVRALE